MHLLALCRVNYMRRCILLGMEKKGKFGAVGWCNWCCLLVGEEERLVKLVKLVLSVVCCCLFIVVTRVTFPSFAASHCFVCCFVGTRGST